MKILQVIPYFLPNWEYGGPIRYVYFFSKELIKAGHSVTVYATKHDASLPKFERIDGINVVRTDILLKIKGYWITPKVLIDLPKQEFDIAHFHSMRTFQDARLFRFFSKKGTPIVVNAHGSLSTQYDEESFLIRKLKFFQDFFLRHLLKRASRLIAVSKMELSDYLNMGCDLKKISIIPLGFNLPAAPTQLISNETDSKLITSLESMNYILFVGRIVERKGLKILLDAFAQLLTNHPDLKLVIIGRDFGYKKHLLRYIQNNKLSQNVLFLGIVTETVLSVAYKNCKFLVYPSKYEIFGSTPLEAASYQKPSIITSTMGISDIFHRNEMGYIVNMGIAGIYT